MTRSEKYINANKVLGAKFERKSHLEDLDMVGGIMLFIFCLLNDIVTQSDDTTPSDDEILNTELFFLF